MNFIFLGSKCWIRKPVVCEVFSFRISEFAIDGYLFTKGNCSGSVSHSPLSWFPLGLSPALVGKFAFANTHKWFGRIAVWVAKFIPSCFLPTVPNTRMVRSLPTSPPRILVVWSHGRGGNVSDNFLMLSQLAVEIPAVVCGITHTDGSADCFRSGNGEIYTYRASSPNAKCPEPWLDFKEYQLTLRVAEIRETIEYIEKTMALKFHKIIVAGFDIGGTTAVAASKVLPVSCIALDGLFCLFDKYPFPKAMFHQTMDGTPKEHQTEGVEARSSTLLNTHRPEDVDTRSSTQLHTPDIPHTPRQQNILALIQSDEWEVWNAPVTFYTKQLNACKLITVKQTNHWNFSEIIYWAPLPLLRFTGVIHRRGEPRKTYRRTTKWISSLISEYTQIEAM